MTTHFHLAEFLFRRVSSSSGSPPPLTKVVRQEAICADLWHRGDGSERNWRRRGSMLRCCPMDHADSARRSGAKTADWRGRHSWPDTRHRSSTTRTRSCCSCRATATATDPGRRSLAGRSLACWRRWRCRSPFVPLESPILKGALWSLRFQVARFLSVCTLVARRRGRLVAVLHLVRNLVEIWQ